MGIYISGIQVHNYPTPSTMTSSMLTSSMTSYMFMTCFLVTSFRLVDGYGEPIITSDATDGEVLIGGSVTITCDKDGNDYPPGRWGISWFGAGYSSDVEVEQTRKDRIEEYDRLDGRHDFVIFELSVEDSGGYYCVWHNEHDEPGMWAVTYSKNTVSFNVCSAKCSSSEVETEACTRSHDRGCSPAPETSPDGYYWDVETTTSDEDGSRTSDPIYVTIVGEKGQSAELRLSDDGRRGRLLTSKDRFFVEGDIGRLMYIEVRKEGTNGWRAKSMEIIQWLDAEYSTPYHVYKFDEEFWLDNLNQDRNTMEGLSKTLTPTEVV